MTLDNEVVELARDLIRIDSTNGNETPVAERLAEFLCAAGVRTELEAKDPARANLVARIPGTGSGPSLAFVGHLDVVPADSRDWSHPPFGAEIDDDGYLFGRGAVDMKNEVAARAVAMARLAREGFAPRGDLWFIAVADEEDGAADVGMRWLLEHRVTALGEAGHASTPTIGDNAVPHLAALLERIGQGLAEPDTSPLLDHTLAALIGGGNGSDVLADRLARAAELHPMLRHSLPPLAGTTMAPTMLGGSAARNVMPARAWVELDCRILPGTTSEQVLEAVRRRLGDDLHYELDLSEPMVPGSASPAAGALPTAIADCLADLLPGAELLPVLCAGYTDSSFLRFAGDCAAYGFSPFRTTPAQVLDEGYHNADERVHVDDLAFSTDFHEALARRFLG